MTFKTNTNPDVFKNEQFFSLSGFRPHVNSVFGNQKRRFSKTVPEQRF